MLPGSAFRLACTASSTTARNLVRLHSHQPASKAAVGWACEQGRRAEMQDRIVVLDPSVEGLEWRAPLLVGVLDGHGGVDVASSAAESFPGILQDLLGEASGQLSGDNCIRLPPSEELLLVLRQAFSATDDELRAIGGSKLKRSSSTLGDADAMWRSSRVDFGLQGSTATVALVDDERLAVSWVGDSHALLCRSVTRNGTQQLKALPMTDIHNPERADERVRIEGSGGVVQRARVPHGDDFVEVGPQRVRRPDGVGGLAVTRALGDFALKLPFGGSAACAHCTEDFVLAEPETHVETRKLGEDLCLIIASDGLWDVVDDTEACAIAAKSIEMHRVLRREATFDDFSPYGEVPKPFVTKLLDAVLGDVDDDDESGFGANAPGAKEASESLVRRAMELGSTDNVSVVVVEL